MATVTADQVVQAAGDLGQSDFTRADIAGKLGVNPADLADGFKAAREANKVEKVGENDDGKGVFRLKSS